MPTASPLSLHVYPQQSPGYQMRQMLQHLRFYGQPLEKPLMLHEFAELPHRSPPVMLYIISGYFLLWYGIGQFVLYHFRVLQATLQGNLQAYYTYETNHLSPDSHSHQLFELIVRQQLIIQKDFHELIHNERWETFFPFHLSKIECLFCLTLFFSFNPIKVHRCISFFCLILFFFLAISKSFTVLSCFFDGMNPLMFPFSQNAINIFKI